MVSALLWAVIGGTVIGLLGKMVAPGNAEEVPLWLTVVCGIGGCLAGDYFYRLIYDSPTIGVDWWRRGWQVGVAAILVAVAATFTGRQRH
jgi:uncharacterized membrane protein YeaQ/YmgE (transglycosylase-associated protein family)